MENSRGKSMRHHQHAPLTGKTGGAVEAVEGMIADDDDLERGERGERQLLGVVEGPRTLPVRLAFVDFADQQFFERRKVYSIKRRDFGHSSKTVWSSQRTLLSR